MTLAANTDTGLQYKYTQKKFQYNLVVIVLSWNLQKFLPQYNKHNKNKQFFRKQYKNT